MHGVAVRQMALDLLALGLTRRDVCRVLGVGYNSTYRW
jgi:transposase-like protein